VSALAQRVRHGLNEARILILGAQVVRGFHFRAPLESGYERLTPTAPSFRQPAAGSASRHGRAAAPHDRRRAA